MAVMGVDVGTSGTKALVFDRRWRVVAEGRASYSLLLGPDGRMELPVEAVLAAVRAVTAACARDAGEPVEAVAFTALGEAIFPCGPSGDPLSDAPVTADGRVAGLSAWWPQHVDLAELKAITELPMRDSWSANRILWWQRHAPELARAPAFRCVEDALVEALGLPATISSSLAARTMLLDTARGTWSERVLALLGLRADQFARVGRPGTPVGRIAGGAGRPFGLADGTVVAVGGHDQFCSALASGSSAERPMWATGTVDSVFFLSPRRLVPLESAVLSYQAEPGRWATAFANLNGGAAFSWLLSLLGPAGKDPGALLKRSIRPARLMAVPLFGTTGAPEFDTDVTGSILGLRYGDGPAEVAYAIIEGIALETRYALEAGGAPMAAIRAVQLAGGGARSRVWAQLKANVLGVPAIRRHQVDTGCTGAAMLAFEALQGERPSVEAVNPIAEVIESDSEQVAIMQERFALYRTLRETLRAGPQARRVERA